MDERSFCLLYKTYFRPHLELSVQAWSPYLRKDIDCLERVQRAATRLVPHLRDLTYEKRLERLGLPTLFDRRRRGVWTLKAMPNQPLNTSSSNDECVVVTSRGLSVFESGLVWVFGL